MKVLMIEFFYPENTYTQELGEALAQNTELVIACKRGVKTPKDGIKWKGLLYEGHHSKLTAPFLYGLSLLRIAREIWFGHYDVVNIQYMRKPKWEIPIFKALRRRYGILVNTNHTLVPHEAAADDFSLHRKFYQACDLLVVHNHPCRDLLISDYKIEAGRICVMPHGVYTRGRNESEIVPSGDGRVRFLMFGQMRKYKGIDVLLNAVALIPPDTRRRLHVTIAGPQYEKLDDTDYTGMANQLGIADCVTFRREHIPLEEHTALFADADICVFPYKELYGSGALLMAYTYEKPVIASDEAIFREETDNQQTGLLFETNDAKALADAITASLDWNEETLESYRNHIRYMKEQKFNWKKSALILTKAYEDAIAKKMKSNG